MSQTDVANFYESVKSNQEVLAQLEQAQSLDGFYDRAVQLGADNGFTFSSQDVEAFVSQKQSETADAELSDSELEAVAGGKGRTCPADTRVTFCVVISSCFGSKC